MVSGVLRRGRISAIVSLKLEFAARYARDTQPRLPCAALREYAPNLAATLRLVVCRLYTVSILSSRFNGLENPTSTGAYQQFQVVFDHHGTVTSPRLAKLTDSIRRTNNEYVSTKNGLQLEKVIDKYAVDNICFAILADSDCNQRGFSRLYVSQIHRLAAEVLTHYCPRSRGRSFDRPCGCPILGSTAAAPLLRHGPGRTAFLSKGCVSAFV